MNFINGYQLIQQLLRQMYYFWITRRIKNPHREVPFGKALFLVLVNQPWVIAKCFVDDITENPLKTA